MNDKPVVPAQPDGPERPVPKGTIAGGIALAWAIVILGHAAMLTLPRWQLLPAPEAGAILAAVVFYLKGQPRTGQGILLGLASIVALGVLLVAACFGLVGLGVFR